MEVIIGLNPYFAKAYLMSKYNDVTDLPKEDYTHAVLQANGAKIKFFTKNGDPKRGKVVVQGKNQSEVNLELAELNQKLEVATPKVFVVFAYKETEVKYYELVKQAIEELGLQAKIMGEQANTGLTLTEKLKRDFIDADFTVVIMTKDEVVEGTQLNRTRPNVVLELGLALGRSWERGEETNPIVIFDEGITGNITDISGLAWHSATDILDEERLKKVLFEEFYAAGLYTL